MRATIITKSPEETISLGKKISGSLKQGDIVSLIGELGSGKTTLIQGICKGLGVKRYVTSPTFVLVNIYQGRVPVYHLDLFRLRGVQDLEGIGYEDYLYGRGIALIEWAEKIREFLPPTSIEIQLKRLAPGKRRITINGLSYCSKACG